VRSVIPVRALHGPGGPRAGPKNSSNKTSRVKYCQPAQLGGPSRWSPSEKLANQQLYCVCRVYVMREIVKCRRVQRRVQLEWKSAPVPGDEEHSRWSPRSPLSVKRNKRTTIRHAEASCGNCIASPRHSSVRTWNPIDRLEAAQLCIRS